MQQNHREAALELAPVAPTHPFELLGEVLPIDALDRMGAQQCRLLLGPREQMVLITTRACVIVAIAVSAILPPP